MHRALIATLAAIVIGLAVPPQPTAAATDGIPTSATTTYTVLPGKGQIRVTISLRISNIIPSTATTIYYVDATWIWVEAGAKQLKVTSDGGPVKVHVDKKTEFFRAYKVTFPRIFKNHSRTITATYVLAGGAPRAKTTDRVNAAYVNFWAFTQPTDKASLKVVLPKAFDVETTGAKVRESTKGALRVLTSGAVADPSKFWLGVTGTNLAGFTKERVTTNEGRTINVLGWPGDTAWMDAVRGEAAASIPKLVTLIGQPLPGTGAIDIRETAGSDLGDAYIASFDEKEQLARVSEEYSQDGTVTHELSHAWFNDSMFDARWMSEGYAQWMERAAGANSTACTAPGAFPGDGTPNLLDWQFANPRATQDELDMVGYEYDAACFIVSEVAAKVGPDRMRDIIGVLATTDGAYPGVPDATAGVPVGWRAWLDAVDELGMRPAGQDDTHAAGDLLVTYGIAAKSALETRTGAREALDAMRSTTTGWHVPLAVLKPMAAWTFDDAEAAMTEAEAIVAAAGEVEKTLPSVDAESGPIHTSYEGAADAGALAAVHGQVSDQLDAAKVVAAAVVASQVKRGFVEELGLADVDLPALAASAVAAVAVLDTATAKAQAGQVTTAVAEASDKGTTKIATAVAIAVAVLLILLILLWVLLRRRRKARRAREATAVIAPPAASVESSVAATPSVEPPVEPAVEPPVEPET